MNDSHIPFVLMTPCPKHTALAGESCWRLETANGPRTAVCNKRAKRAGFDAPISAKSLSFGDQGRFRKSFVNR